jgi:RimJ/RimL family protein N-acetyltransferase
MSERIELREAVLEDVDEEYTSWYANDDHHLDTFTNSGKGSTPEYVLKNFKENLVSKVVIYWLIIDKATKTRIGTIRIGPIDYRHKTSDLVCLIGNRSFLGKGLAKEAIAMASKLAFEKYDFRRLYGGMYATNVASIKAYLGAGWKQEGLLRGFYWVDGAPVDRVLVCCLNPKYFPDF